MQPGELQQYVYDPAIAEYRRAAGIRQAEAFCPGLDSVLGIPVQPITPSTYSRLSAIGSPFVGSGRPTREADVANYIWFHSRLFTVNRFLAPSARWLALLSFRGVLRRQRHIDYYAAALALAISDIEQIIDRAFACASSGGSPGAPVASLEAQFIHAMGAAYGWSPERTRATPLAQLFQLDRAQAMAAGAEIVDRGEFALKEARLRKRNAELAAARARPSALPPSPSGLKP